MSRGVASDELVDDADGSPPPREGRDGRVGALRPRTSRLLARLAMGILGAALLVFLLLPFYWMVKSAFQPNVEIVAIPPLWLPREWTLEGFQRATTMIPFSRYIFNSLYVSIVATVLSTALAAMAGYVLARFRFPGALWILTIFLLCQLIPPITRLFPVYFLIQDVGLINTYTGLIVAYMGLAVPLAALLLQGYFRRSCPVELEEAAFVDGCSYFKTFLKVVLPVSRSGIIAVACFVFLFAWNDFLWARVLM
jgi:multiple sugar transport system permease protein